MYNRPVTTKKKKKRALKVSMPEITVLLGIDVN